MTRRSDIVLERDVQDCLAQSKPTSSASPAVGSTIELSGRTYVVTRAGRHGADLRGARGGDYALIQNRNDPSLWSLIPGGRMKPRGEWYRRRDDGSFERMQ